MSQQDEQYIQSMVTAVVSMIQIQISLLYLKSDSCWCVPACMHGGTLKTCIMYMLHTD